tara:strand:+ start:3194 stop:3655 length:462 start_codon:yes stop_codon:yes gene_type:complete
MELDKIKLKAEDLIDIIALNNDKEGFHGDGLSIPEIPEIPIKHFFADQVYIRQMNMSADQFVVGAVHNHLHVWFLLTGKVSIIEDDETIDHVAPCFTISKPGIQRVIYAHEDSIFINIHKNPENLKNIDDLEKEIVSMTKEEFNKKNNKTWDL